MIFFLKYIFRRFIAIIFLICGFGFAFAQMPQPPEIAARSFLIIDVSANQVLAQKDANTPVEPASLTKLMTAYLVFQAIESKKINLAQTLPVSNRAWKMPGSRMFIDPKMQVPVEDLIKGMIVQSGNDACIALAEGISGSEEEFTKLMNNKAKEIGLKDSYFVNATGWPNEAHVMSAKDLAILSKKIMDDFPEYYYLFSIKEFTFNNIKQGNRNALLYRDIGVDGLKTGHTDLASYGMTASAKKGNRRLILVINGLESNIKRSNEAEKILNYGFLNFDNVTLIKKGQAIANVKVWLGVDKILPVIASEDIIVTIPKDRIKDIKLNGNIFC
jgi:D-alanyl-D-alanine carboxypeptidase (penicillin-binding protein 5/6)